MNLIDQLTQMQAEGKQVVSITFILNHLRESQRHEKGLNKQLIPNSINNHTIDSKQFEDMKIIKTGGF